MSDFVIIPDTSSDFTKALRERFDVADYISGIVNFPDGHSEPADLDWVKYDPIDFYNSMKDKKTLYTTATPTIGNVLEVFEKQLALGNDILSMSLSSALSGTLRVCQTAAEQLLEKYPDRKIICVDTMRYSTAAALLVMMAAEKRNSGATLEETAQYIENNKHRIHQMGPMDDLFFLTKTGRISNFKAFFGTLVGVNPMADFNRKGMSQVLAKFKGKQAAFDATIAYVKGTIENASEQIIFIAHSNREAAAHALAERVQKEIGPKEIIINHVGMSCGCSIGPGLCAVFYQGKEISEDGSAETALMNRIVEDSKKKK